MLITTITFILRKEYGLCCLFAQQQQLLLSKIQIQTSQTRVNMRAGGGDTACLCSPRSTRPPAQCALRHLCRRRGRHRVKENPSPTWGPSFGSAPHYLRSLRRALRSPFPPSNGPLLFLTMWPKCPSMLDQIYTVKSSPLRHCNTMVKSLYLYVCFLLFLF